MMSRRGWLVVAVGVLVSLTAGCGRSLKHGDLFAAASKGDLADVKDLLRRGADVNAYTGTGHTALHFAAFGNHAEVVRVLLEHGAEVNVQDEEGKTPLGLAEDIGRGVVADLLRQHRAQE